MAECNRCGKTIEWHKNPDTDKWVPYDPGGGECHFITCKGAPAKGTKKDLLNRIAELEEQLDATQRQLDDARRRASNYQNAYDRQQEAHIAELERVREFRKFHFTNYQNVINAAKAIVRAKQKKRGTVRMHYQRLLKAAEALLKAEDRAKKR